MFLYNTTTCAILIIYEMQLQSINPISHISLVLENKYYVNVLCFRNSPAPVFPSPAPTIGSSLTVLLSMTPHPHQKSPTFWMKVSWSAPSVMPLILPAATGSSWHTSTTALLKLMQSPDQWFPPQCQDLPSN